MVLHNILKRNFQYNEGFSKLRYLWIKNNNILCSTSLDEGIYGHLHQFGSSRAQETTCCLVLVDDQTTFRIVLQLFH